MPNWCSNNLTLRHNDPAQITRAVAAFQRGEFMNEFVPLPEDQRDNWYDWQVSNWGTKWDVGESTYEADLADDGQVAYFSFDSAWAPPVEFYDSITQQGFEVEAYYYEPGVGFAGKWTSEDGDDCYSFEGMNADELEKELPQDINDEFGITETMREYEDEEPLTEWYLEGVKEKGLDKND